MREVAWSVSYGFVDNGYVNGVTHLILGKFRYYKADGTTEK